MKLSTYLLFLASVLAPHAAAAQSAVLSTNCLPESRETNELVGWSGILAEQSCDVAVEDRFANAAPTSPIRASALAGAGELRTGRLRLVPAQRGDGLHHG